MQLGKILVLLILQRIYVAVFIGGVIQHLHVNMLVNTIRKSLLMRKKRTSQHERKAGDQEQ